MTKNSKQLEIDEAQSSNKRIAKNTLALYVRMFLTMIVGLYTSRVVLATLGVEDYGVYGVVGGVMSMLGFLNASMSGATSRFLTFELGRGDKERLGRTFSSALVVHIGIALVVLVLAETVGLWFLCNKLVIPSDRMTAAMWVYQFAVAGSMLGITQVPYNATIIAHENMNVYAYVEILNSVLKLGIVYLLTIGNFDKLKLYAVLLFAVSVVVMITYRVYCLRHYAESHFHWIWDKAYLRPLLSFSGWNLYGNFGSVASIQGINFVVNLFWGVALNAAVSLASSVAGMVNLFASNAITAFRPPIIKLCAQKEVLEMQRLTQFAIVTITFLYAVVAIPVFLECDFILSVWLVEVPKYTVILCQTVLVSIFFEIIRYVVIINIHASGNVKNVSAASGTMLSLVPVLLYGAFCVFPVVQISYILLAAANVLLLSINLGILKHNIPSIAITNYCLVIVKVFLVSGAILVLLMPVKQNVGDGWLSFLLLSGLSVVLTSLSFFLFCFDSEQKIKIRHFVAEKIKNL